MTQVLSKSKKDPEDSMPILKLADTEKRPAETALSDVPPSKKLKSDCSKKENSFPFKVELMKKDLVKKTQEATNLLSFLNQAEASNRNLMDKAKAVRTTQGKVEAKEEETESAAESAKAKAKATEVRVTEVKEKLKEALDSKKAKIKAADEKAYAEDITQLQVPFPPVSDTSEAEAKDDDEDEVEVEVVVEATTEAEVDTLAKSSTLNDQVLDLTGEDEDEVPKNTSPTKTTYEVKVQAAVQAAERGLDETLLEIDAKIQVDKFAQLTTEAETLPIAEATQSKENITQDPST
ncbi:uncharacterized protein LOC114259459 [Camellia sinensis]|uniref:uncharacterized protein LOC114259459 n=1 Tax=Camellia sinensis TaxID=4442 RepID=UPI0010362461|nr:uncharacterized protein LOC114259459 [Camellia sinensis]